MFLLPPLLTQTTPLVDICIQPLRGPLAKRKKGVVFNYRNLLSLCMFLTSLTPHVQATVAAIAKITALAVAAAVAAAAAVSACVFVCVCQVCLLAMPPSSLF